MSQPNPDLRGRSLMAVFAHPDDESLGCGGLLAWCADRGVSVTLLCATRGEHGPGHDASARTRELDAAARVLGVTRTILLDYEDGMLPWVDAGALEADIRNTIRSVQPDVVVTFGEDGLYWHPDHIAVHERTTAAVAELDPLPALYYVTMPPGAMRAVIEHAGSLVTEQAGGAAPRELILGIDDPDAFGALASAPTLVVDAGAYAVRKLAAIRCHRTQLADSPLDLITDADAPRLLGTEHFRRAVVGSSGEAFIEQLGSRS